MPIYAFECTHCGHRFDRLQRLADDDPTTCPECGAEGEVRRQLTAPSFRLAGGGWYETDFKKDGKRNLADKSDSSSGAGDAGTAKSDSKSDSKSESKSDSKSDSQSESKSDPKPSSSGDAKAPASTPTSTTPAAKPAPKSDT
ncbi:hypothetical protein BH11PSE14_BH11PSE14_22330 [soil metagenome]